MSAFLIHLAPFFALVLVLVARRRRYPGERLLTPRVARRPLAARRLRPRALSLLPPRHGLLLAAALSGRGPPA